MLREFPTAIPNIWSQNWFQLGEKKKTLIDLKREQNRCIVEYTLPIFYSQAAVFSFTVPLAGLSQCFSGAFGLSLFKGLGVRPFWPPSWKTTFQKWDFRNISYLAKSHSASKRSVFALVGKQYSQFQSVQFSCFCHILLCNRGHDGYFHRMNYGLDKWKITWKAVETEKLTLGNGVNPGRLNFESNVPHYTLKMIKGLVLFVHS